MKKPGISGKTDASTIRSPFVPWTIMWDSNYLLQPWPALRSWLLDPFARGVVSGLGLVNVLLALDDARLLLFGRR